VSVTVLRDRFTWSLPVSVTLSVAGCGLVVGVVGGTGLEVSPAGLLWGLASAVFFAGYTLMGRWAAHRYSSWTLLTYGLGAAMLFWWAMLGGPGPVFAVLRDGRTFAAVAFIAFVGTVVPFGAFLKALRHIRATEASVTSTLEPVLAAVAAWALFRESLTLTQMLGGLLVLAAIVVSQLPNPVAVELPPAN
jgi:drug/metabolite transporter (DMT)-like permease